jgi:predicted transcriptional regulator
MSTRKKRESQLPPMASLTVRFPKTDLEAMRHLAQRNHRSLNSEMVHAIAEYLRTQKVSETDPSDG